MTRRFLSGSTCDLKSADIRRGLCLKSKKRRKRNSCRSGRTSLRLDEAEETLQAIRQGGIDALVVSGPLSDQVYLLQGAEHTYRVLVEWVNEGALAITESGDIIYCNTAFVAMAGILYEKLVGVSFRNLVTEKDKEKFDTLWKKALLGTVTDEIELTIKGGRRPVYLSCSTRVIDGVLTVFAIATDITERKKAQEALKKAHDELELRVEERTMELSNLNDKLKSEIEIRKAAEKEIRRHVEELSASNDKLSRFNRVAVGRELRMVELKKEVNELRIKLGEQPRYKLDFLEKQA